ncbi:hypothetical protein TIFTF001_021401 [Ficus carica]|uniref:Uncharacterized protein n=1 Tax=Ficus carica TaxID=3494 RepID=A0AA88AYT0_FICCA|nr:hypothetical protein TIFTF001_021401 [Ficus carica]
MMQWRSKCGTEGATHVIESGSTASKFVVGTWTFALSRGAGQLLRPASARIAGPRAGRAAAGGDPACSGRDPPPLQACPRNVLGLDTGRSLVFLGNRKRKLCFLARSRSLLGDCLSGL